MKSLVAISLLICVSACGADKKEKSKINTKLRSNGTFAASLLLKAHQESAGFLITAGTQRANSSVKLDQFKVPVRSINLVKGLGGAGGFSSSPDIYSCTAADEAECLVDLADASLDNLLASAGSMEMETEGETYNGISVQHCRNYNIGDKFNAIVKGTVSLAGVTYYTNGSAGLSTTGPAEEAKIPMACMGSDSYLLDEIVVNKDSTVDVVLYAEPNGIIFATDNPTLANSNCAGTGVAICSNNINVFGTIDSARPAVERYLLETEGTNSDVIMSLLVNSSGKIFGATASEFFVDANETKVLHTPSMTFATFNEASTGKYDIDYGSADGSRLTFISKFERAAHSGTIATLVDTPIAYTARKL